MQGQWKKTKAISQLDFFQHNILRLRFYWNVGCVNWGITRFTRNFLSNVTVHHLQSLCIPNFLFVLNSKLTDSAKAISKVSHWFASEKLN